MHLCIRLLCAGVLVFVARGEISSENRREKHQVPSFTISSLQTPSFSEKLAAALRTTGLLAIQLDDGNYQNARESSLEGLCRCTSSSAFREIEGTDSSATLLSDKFTTRTTLATATVGNTPLSLPHEDLKSACGTETAESMELLRDYVAHASNAFVSALDRLLYLPGETTTPLLRTIHGVEYSSIKSIVKASTNLEHFHVYSKQKSTQDTKVLDLHTDAGLFLAFVPGQSCENTGEQNVHFYIQHDGVQQQVDFPPNSIGIMLGAGAQHWLNTSNSLSLKATRHAVYMQPGESRAWFGMMHLVPKSAIVQQEPDGPVTLGDLQLAMSKSFYSGKNEDVSIGCGNYDADANQEDVENPVATLARRRRLQHITDGSTCNNVTNFFCWMTCQDIPDADKAQEYTDQGKSLYCLEPAVLASSQQVSSAVDPCTEIGVVGAAMNEACVGSWQPTAEGVPSQEVRLDVAAKDLDEPFCYGGTSMYMDGFQWIGTTCVIYLFPDWVLQTPAAIVGACIGTLAFGIALEGVIYSRRSIVQGMPEGWKQTGVSTLLYGVQLTMGYMLMLVVMTYSGPLFLCVVVGLMMGHVGFNSKLFKSKKHAGYGEHSTHLESNASNEGDCCAAARSSRGLSEGPSIPEGSTPCCQNTL